MNQINIKNSLGLRITIIALLSLALLIPSFMLQVLIKERQERRDVAVKEVFSKWGDKQIIAGPILSIPYRAYMEIEDRGKISTIKYMHILPNDMHVEGIVTPEIRYRGIYEAVLYNVALQIKGFFVGEEIEQGNINEDDIIWNDSFIAVGISDMKGIKDLVEIKWNDDILISNPGIKTKDVLSSGISVKVPVSDAIQNYKFSFNLNINGSDDLEFTPIGKETKVKLSSSWTNPSFSGEFLPERRDINEDGFTAEWKILHLNRNYPQSWTGDEFDINKSTFGVRLLLPVDEYQKTMRTAKYAIMYIALTFLSFFMIELLNRKVIHPIQYLLIGFALLVFYTLLLAFSEHLIFKCAYLIASSAIIILIAGYTKSVLKDNIQTLLIFFLLIILYSYLYIVLQMQDYALLLGSIALFVILTVVMFVTRKIDWFSIFRTSGDNQVSEA